jgi:MFS family permease
LAALCCIAAALSPFPALSLAGCVLATLGASLLWPGAVVLASRQFPLAGAWLFAMLALGGDLGAALGPYLTGITADHAVKVPFLSKLQAASGLPVEQFNLRTALCLAAFFPLLTAAILLIFDRFRVKTTADNQA